MKKSEKADAERRKRWVQLPLVVDSARVSSVEASPSSLGLPFSATCFLSQPLSSLLFPPPHRCFLDLPS